MNAPCCKYDCVTVEKTGGTLDYTQSIECRDLQAKATRTSFVDIYTPFNNTIKCFNLRWLCPRFEKLLLGRNNNTFIGLPRT